MVKLPDPQSDFSVFGDMFYGAVASRLLMSAIDLAVFEHLEQAASAQAVARLLPAHPRNAQLMLDALCALGLLRKSQGQYQNQPSTSEFLVRGKAAYLGHWLQLADESWQDCLGGLTDKIRSGPGQAPPDEHWNAAAYCERFTRAHAATSLAGVARQMAAIVADAPGFDACRRMLDLGGGPGVNAMAVAQANEGLAAVVFDRPEIVAIARGYIDEYGMSERVSTMGGDYLSDDIGGGYDLIMVTDSLYYGDAELDRVLAKCRQALAPGGLLVGVHAVLTDEATKPAKMVLAMLPEALAGQAALPERGFLARAMARHGFAEISSRMAMVAGAPMEVNVGRRPAEA